jgi:glycosyltransferase involved in cell wall biosynthesis
MTQNFVPVFYARGFDEPFTEGHIQILRMLVRSLSSRNVPSVVLNYKYSGDNEAKIEQASGNDCFWKYDQKIPIIRREDAIAARKRAVVLSTSFLEAAASLKFMLTETTLARGSLIVNITNCFRYSRLLARRVFKAPVLVHFYMKDTPSKLKALMKISDFFLATSRTVADHLSRTCDVPREKIGVIYPPIDTDLYKPVGKEYARNALGLPRNDKIILYMGNLDHSRFPENIVFQMMKSYATASPRTVLHIFSPKSIENAKRAFQISRQATLAGLEKHVMIETRNISDAEKSLIYNAADVFLFPSTENGVVVEPPLSVLEAMSTGLPVVSSEISSLRELIDDGKNGFFASEDTKLASCDQKINLLISSAKLARRIGLSSRETILSKASIELAGGKLCNIYQNLLKS